MNRSSSNEHNKQKEEEEEEDEGRILKKKRKKAYLSPLFHPPTLQCTGASASCQACRKFQLDLSATIQSRARMSRVLLHTS
jgi:hypothetical protein